MVTKYKDAYRVEVVRTGAGGSRNTMSYFSDEYSSYVYSPSTLQRLVPTADSRYFVESDIPLLIDQVNNPSLLLSEKGTAYLGEWKKLDHLEWKVEGTTVYDWRHEGASNKDQTLYWHRRRRPPPAGYQWDEETEGMQYGLSSLYPVENTSVKTWNVPHKVVTPVNHVLFKKGEQSGDTYRLTLIDEEQVILEAPVSVYSYGARLAQHFVQQVSEVVVPVKTLQFEGRWYSKIPDTSCIIFHSRRDLVKHLPRLWVVPCAEDLVVSALDPSGQAKFESSDSTPLMTRVLGEVIAPAWQTGGITVGELSRRTSLTHSHLMALSVTSSGIYQWSFHPYTMVHRDRIGFSLPGVFQEDFFDGRRVSDLLYYLEEGATSFSLTYMLPPEALTFFNAHSSCFEVIDRGAYVDYRVRGWKRS